MTKTEKVMKPALGIHYPTASRVITALANKFSGRYDGLTVEELAESTWVKLKDKFPSYSSEDKGTFNNWVYNLAYNHMTKYSTNFEKAAPKEDAEPVRKSLFDDLTEEEVTSIARIIVSRAVAFSQKFPFLVTDDLIQEGWKEVIKYQYHFDPNKGKVTSWVYMVVNDILTSFAQKEYNKTQKWDDLDDHPGLEKTQVTARAECSYTDLVQTLKQVLSPRCFSFMKMLEKNPRVCLSTLSEELELSERDIGYLREELRVTTRHVLKNG
jgi:DNA-directed RNA polymerase specialized sigma24 family protein